jgi:fructokinase
LGADAATFMSSPPSADLNSHAALTPRASGEPPTVFGTGLLALDIILSADPRRAPVLAAGGTCGNVLTALAYLGWEAYPVARLNDDVASAIVRADLERSGVALDFAAQAPGAATPIIVQAIRHDRRGAPTHRFSLACPACGAWFPSYRAVVQDAALAVVDAVADAAYGGFAGPRVFFFDRVSRGALTLARAFANRGALIVFEPVGIGDPKLFAEALNVTHVLKYSRERVPMLADRSLTGGFGEWSHTGPRGRGPRIEIETMGAEGLRFRTVHDSGARWRVLPAISSPIVRDTAGAGDWCTAGFLASLGMAGVSGVEGATVSEVEGALRVGQAAAAIGCSFEGARGVMSACSATEFQNAVNAALHPTELGTSSGMPVVGDAQALTDFAFAPTPALHCENPAAKNGRVRALATPLGVETWTGVCPACPREALV